MILKRLKDCENIFLDSGVIIDKLKIDLSSSSDDVVKRIEQIRMFFTSLKSFKNKFTFQISSISIAEIFHLDNIQDNVPAAIMEAFDNCEVEIYSFDVYAALYHNEQFHSILGNKAIDEIKKLVNYPISQHANIRDRIRKDILIAATAKLYNSDVVLTNDGGFQNLCNKFEISSHCFTGKTSDFHMSNDNKTIYDFA